MEIVPARREDIPALAALEAENFSLGPDAAALERMRAGGGCVILCAREGETLLGFGYFQFVMDEGYMGDLAVGARHRRRGIGRALLEALLREARARELHFLTLEVRQSNRPAIELYEKCGFTRVGLRKNYYEKPRENALLMTADLGGRGIGMLILSVESTCDETAVAVTENGRRVLTDQIFSQADLHAIYGGVVPEIASRSHVEVISRLADNAIREAGIAKGDLDAVAVSYAPGLIGAVLVGVNFAKSAAMALGIPLIPVHHLRGHMAANYIAFPDLEPPFVCLAVSGGNTLLAEVRGYTDMRVLGRTRDDAAGECFDKSARVLGLPYPGGGPIDRLAQTGRDDRYPLPRPYVGENPYDMSFSGLKTAVINLAHHAEQTGETLDRPGLAASLCRAVSETLVPRTMAACRQLGYKKLAVAGGVAANSRIRRDFAAAAQAEGVTLYIPPLKLCGDNAAMIGCQGYYEYLAGHTAGSDLNAYANMEI